MSDQPLEALCVREKDGKSYWTKIGMAWPSRSGAGWIIRLDANPLDGVIHLRPKLPRREAGTTQGREPGQDDDFNF